MPVRSTLRYVATRLLLMVPTLLGITLVTFLLMDLAPVDRAQIELARAQQEVGFQEREGRELALARLRMRYGLVDPATGEARSVWQRYGWWLWHAATFRLAGPHEEQESFRQRLLDAVPVSLLLGFWALLAAVLLGVPLGIWLGLRTGSTGDRSVSTALFLLAGIPEFLLATLLLIALGGIWLDWFPSGGLRSDDAAAMSAPGRLLDLAWHMMLPVLTLAAGPTALIARFLRESLSRAARAPFAVNLRAWGTPPAAQARRLLRNSLSPLATLVGSLLPMVVAGSVVVETVFSIDGLGRLAYHAVLNQDQGMVMALTLLGSVATLGGLLLSDVMQRIVDPRVQLAR